MKRKEKGEEQHHSQSCVKYITGPIMEKRERERQRARGREKNNVVSASSSFLSTSHH
jgi:hypothetical protein